MSPNPSAALCALSILVVLVGCSVSRQHSDQDAPPTISWRGSPDAATDQALLDLSASHDDYCRQIAAVLGVPEERIRPHTRVIVRKRLRAAGMALGHRIWLHEGITGGHNLEELHGLYLHELTHTFQDYPLLLKPTWLVEGIADYTRHKLTPDSSWSHRARRRFYRGSRQATPEIHYTDGYFSAAQMLEHIEANYDPQFVQRVHQELRLRRYDDGFFEARTGKSLDVLWEETLATSRDRPPKRAPSDRTPPPATPPSMPAAAL